MIVQIPRHQGGGGRLRIRDGNREIITVLEGIYIYMRRWNITLIITTKKESDSGKTSTWILKEKI